MSAGLFFLLTFIGVIATAVHVYRKRKYTEMTPTKRPLGFLISAAIGVGFLIYMHGANDAGEIMCGRRCDTVHRDTHPVIFWLTFLFLWAGAVCSLAISIVALIRPDDAGDLSGEE